MQRLKSCITAVKEGGEGGGEGERGKGEIRKGEMGEGGGKLDLRAQLEMYPI